MDYFRTFFAIIYLSTMKNNKLKNKHKIRNTIIYSLLAILILCLASFVTLNILITDKTRNTNEVANATNEQVIQNRLVESLDSTDDDFDFFLSQDEINVLLSNSLKEDSISKYVESAYYSNNDTNHIWCFDLKVPVFTTRLVISSHIESISNEFYMFKIDSMKIGKINAWSMLISGGYISDDLFNTLFTNANLPISSFLNNGMFLFEPLKFIDSFSLGEVTSELFRRINSLDRLEINPNAIGFKLKLDGVKVDPVEQDLLNFNLPEELGSKLTLESYENLREGENEILKVSESQFSSWIKNCFSKNKSLETIRSPLSNKTVICKLVNISVSFLNNQFAFVWCLQIGNIYLNVSYSLGEPISASNYKLSFFRSIDESSLETLLFEDFLDNISENEYMHFYQSNYQFDLDFETIINSSSIYLLLSVLFKRLIIENNSLVFYLNNII